MVLMLGLVLVVTLPLRALMGLVIFAFRNKTKEAQTTEACCYR
jgi:hypothetical protein